jgi:hypothetical protein
MRVEFALAAILLALSATASQKLPSGGFLGVPWSGSRDQFRQAIPGLSCAPIVCRAHIAFGGIPASLELTWGGFSPVITSALLSFERSSVGDMKRFLTNKYGSPNRRYVEDGETVTEWKLPDVLVDLYPGQGHGVAKVYYEPKRKR